MRLGALVPPGGAQCAGGPVLILPRKKGAVVQNMLVIPARCVLDWLGVP